MPTRILRDGINSSERVDRLSANGELFYRRVMSIVDDYGRHPANPALIRSAAWPLNPNRFSDTEIISLLQECVDVGIVIVYAVGEKAYLQYSDFKQRARTPKYPPPPEDIDSSVSVAALCEQLRTFARKGRSNDGALRTFARLVEGGGVVGDEGEGAVAATQILPYDAGDLEPLLNVSKKTVNQDHAIALDNVWSGIDIEAVSERMYALHPKKRDKGLVASALLSIVDKVKAKGKDPIKALARIEEVHAAWCATESWQEKDGRFAPVLAEWLNDEGYTKTPSGFSPKGSKPKPKPPQSTLNLAPDGLAPEEYDAMFGEVGWFEKVGKHIGIKARTN